MTIHETATQITLETTRIASMAQTANDQCQRMQARIEELESALARIEAINTNTGEFFWHIRAICNKALNARAVLAKGN